MTPTRPTLLLGTTELTDQVSVARYLKAVGTTIERHGGTIRLAGPVTVLEGDTTPSTGVVIEFPDSITAAAWFDSAEYSELRALSRTRGRNTVVLFEQAHDSRWS